MKYNLRKCHLKKFFRSKLALALPVTFLILFVSTLGIVAFTYFFSVERINAQGTTLKVSTAKQNMLSLDDAVVSTMWQPGSQTTYDFSDSGGQLKIEPTSNLLTLSITSPEIQDPIFNASIGKVVYVLPYSGSSETGLYLKGDARVITKQTGSSLSQLGIKNGLEHPEIQLRYRPSVTYALGGVEDGRAVNNIRIYISNLNSSNSFSLFGKLPLQAICGSTELTTKDYQVSTGVDSFVISAVLDGVSGTVSVPISSTPQGAEIHLEIVICHVSIERWIH